MLCRRKRVLFRGFTFDLAAGDRVAVMGDSGSGKSSQLQVLLGRVAFGIRMRPAQRMHQVSQGENWAPPLSAFILLGGRELVNTVFQHRDPCFCELFGFRNAA